MVIAFIAPPIIKCILIDKSLPISNEAVASFFGSYAGGVLGGLGTMIAMYITIKHTLKIQEDNKKDTDKQIAANRQDREAEQKRNEELKEQEIRRAFADDIAVLLGKYIADISKYHYASIFAEQYNKNMKLAQATMEKKKIEYEKVLGQTDQTSDKTTDHTSKNVSKEMIEFDAAIRKYEEKRKAYDDNSIQARRIVANEALFTIETKLYGIECAKPFLNCLFEIHKNVGFEHSDRQIGEWLEEGIEQLQKHYADFRIEYVQKRTEYTERAKGF